MGIRFSVHIFDLAQVVFFFFLSFFYTGSPYDVTLPIYGRLSNLGIYDCTMFCSLDIKELTLIHCIHNKNVK